MLNSKDEVIAKALAEEIVNTTFGSNTKPKTKDIREKTAEAAKPLHESLLGLMDAGFSETQAFKLLLETL